MARTGVMLPNDRRTASGAEDTTSGWVVCGAAPIGEEILVGEEAPTGLLFNDGGDGILSRRQVPVGMLCDSCGGHTVE